MADGNERAIAGAAFTAFHDLGANDWGDDYNRNMRKASVGIINASAKSRESLVPGTGAAGDIYIVPSNDGLNPNRVAVWDKSGEGLSTDPDAWVYLDPALGMIFYVVDEDANYQFNGTDWVKLQAGIADAPQDGKSYVRRDGAWVEAAGAGGGSGTLGITTVLVGASRDLTADDRFKALDVTATSALNVPAALFQATDWFGVTNAGGTATVSFPPGISINGIAGGTITVATAFGAGTVRFRTAADAIYTGAGSVA
ncbi:MAG: hypothetical protein AAF830_15680 [Pseudomonadota bacterium]